MAGNRKAVQIGMRARWFPALSANACERLLIALSPPTCQRTPVSLNPRVNSGKTYQFVSPPSTCHHVAPEALAGLWPKESRAGAHFPLLFLAGDAVVVQVPTGFGNHKATLRCRGNTSQTGSITRQNAGADRDDPGRAARQRRRREARLAEQAVAGEHA
jgi:hypothetical protein